MPGKDTKCEALLAAAAHHKDRLHSLQNTEWNVYYAVWLVVLASAYFINSASHNFFPDIADGIAQILRSTSYNSQWSIRICRSALSFLAVTAFYLIIFIHYFFGFYSKNYSSLVRSRSLFCFYLNHALAHACSPSSDAASTDAPKTAAMPRCQPPFVEYTVTRKDFVHIADTFAKLEDPKICQSQSYEVKEVSLPYALEQQSKNFKESKIYKSRRRVMACTMVLIIASTTSVAFLSPINSDVTLRSTKMLDDAGK